MAGNNFQTPGCYLKLPGNNLRATGTEFLDCWLLPVCYLRTIGNDRQKQGVLYLLKQLPWLILW
jgi:hypothetical protein